MHRKAFAIDFLKLASSGNVQEAYVKYVHPDFVHHNPYFAGDRASLMKGMIENHAQFPDKVFTPLHVLGDGDLVAVHEPEAHDNCRVATINFSASTS